MDAWKLVGPASQTEFEASSARCCFQAFKSFVNYEHAPDLHDIKPEERVAFVEGFRSSSWRQLLFALVALLTGGATLLLGHWLPLRRFLLLHIRCSLGTATHFLVQTQSGSFKVVKAQRVPFDLRALTASPGSRCVKRTLSGSQVCGASLTRAEQEEGEECETSLTRSSSCSSSRSSDEAEAVASSSEAELPSLVSQSSVSPSSLASPPRPFFCDEGREALEESNSINAYSCCTCDGGQSKAGSNEEEALLFEFMSIRYYLHKHSPDRCFLPLTFDVSLSASDLVHAFVWHAPCCQLRERRRALFGACTLRVPCPSVVELLLEEVLEPFYVFQLFAIVLWLVDEYVQYAAAISLITAISTFSDVSTRRKNIHRLREAARLNTPVEVVRRRCCCSDSRCGGAGDSSRGTHAAKRCSFSCSNEDNSPDNKDCNNLQMPSELSPCSRVECLYVESIPSEELVNGDLLILRPDMRLPCDILLLRGSAVVDECNLTGESFPVRKSALPLSQATQKKLVVEQNQFKSRRMRFACTKEARHMLFAGSRVVSVSGGCFGGADSSGLPPALAEADAVGGICRVGFATSQGQTLRPLLFPSHTRLRFDTESLRFLCVLAALTAFAAVYALVICTRQGMTPYKTFLRVFDLFTDAVPPALRAALSVALTAATSRLFSLYGIVCSAPSRINVSGYVRCLCVDKTGTLTEEGVSLQACIPACHCGGGISTAPVAEPKATHRRLTFSRSSVSRKPASSSGGRSCASPVFEAPELPSSDFCFDAGVKLSVCPLRDCVLCGSSEEEMGGGDASALRLPRSTVANGEAVPVVSRCVPGQPAPCMCRMHLFRCLSCCSSLVSVDEEGFGGTGGSGVAGDPLEVEMLAVSGWTLVGAPRVQTNATTFGGEGTQPVFTKKCLYTRLAEQVQSVAPHALGDLTFVIPPNSRLGGNRNFSPAGVLCVVRRFEFCAVLQRMSVLAVEVETGSAFVYCKGSPESVFQLCSAWSLPPDAEQKVQSLAAGGLRVLATAARRLTARETGRGCRSLKTLSRRRAERDLCFLGLMVFHNELKADAVSTMSALRNARVDVRILTGDSAYTTVSVAEQCGLLDAKAEVAARCPESVKRLPECACFRSPLSPPRCQVSLDKLDSGPGTRTGETETGTGGGASKSLREVLKTVDLQNSRVVILGDVYARHEEHVGRREYLLWSLLLRPKCTSLPAEGGRTATTSLRRREVSTFIDFYSGSAPPAMVLRASRRTSAAPHPPKLQHFPSLDLRELLAALPDARLPILVLTGRAFRHLRRLNALLNLPFAERCDALVDEILTRHREAWRPRLEAGDLDEARGPKPHCLLNRLSLSVASASSSSQPALGRTGQAVRSDSADDGFVSERETVNVKKREARTGAACREEAEVCGGRGGGCQQQRQHRPSFAIVDSESERVRQFVEALMFKPTALTLAPSAPLESTEATFGATSEGGASSGTSSSLAVARNSLLVPTGLRRASEEVSGVSDFVSNGEEAVLLQREAFAALHKRLDALNLAAMAATAGCSANGAASVSLSRVDQIHKALQLAEHQRAEAESLLALSEEVPAGAASAAANLPDPSLHLVSVSQGGLDVRKRRGRGSACPFSGTTGSVLMPTSPSFPRPSSPSPTPSRLSQSSRKLHHEGLEAFSPRCSSSSPKSRAAEASSDSSSFSPGREGRLAFVCQLKRAALKAAKKALPTSSTDFGMSPTGSKTDSGEPRFGLEALQAPLLSEDRLFQSSHSDDESEERVAIATGNTRQGRSASPSRRVFTRVVAGNDASSSHLGDEDLARGSLSSSHFPSRRQKVESASSRRRKRPIEEEGGHPGSSPVGLELLSELQHGEGLKALDGMTLLFRSKTCRCCEKGVKRGSDQKQSNLWRLSEWLRSLRLRRTASPEPTRLSDLSERQGVSPRAQSGSLACVASETAFHMSLYEFALRQTALLCRASPQDKGDFIAALQELPADPFVGMAGDGTNDLVAIKRADLGISIAEIGQDGLSSLGAAASKPQGLRRASKEETFISPGASLASSFTVRCLDSCVSLLREGRCVLQNSIALVLFITLYSFIELCSVLTMYTAGKNLTDAQKCFWGERFACQYMWVDLLTILPLSLGLSQAEAPLNLSTEVPPKSLFAKPILLSVLGQACLQLGFQVAGYAAFLRTPRESLKAPSHTSKSHLVGSDNTSVFLLSSLQYLYVCAAVGSSGRQWKRGVVTNWRCTVYMLFLGVLALNFLLFPPDDASSFAAGYGGLDSEVPFFFTHIVYDFWLLCSSVYAALYRWLGLVPLPTSLRMQLCGLSLLNFAATISFETLVVNPVLQAHVKRVEKDGGGTSILKKSREACSVSVMWPE